MASVLDRVLALRQERRLSIERDTRSLA